MQYIKCKITDLTLMFVLENYAVNWIGNFFMEQQLDWWYKSNSGLTSGSLAQVKSGASNYPSDHCHITAIKQKYFLW